jgi:hypothetical protein
MVDVPELKNRNAIQNRNSRIGFTPRIHPHNSKIIGFSPELSTIALDLSRENLRLLSIDLLCI